MYKISEHNGVITKNSGKIRTSSKPNNLEREVIDKSYQKVIRKVLIRAIQNLLFIEFEPLCQKLWGFISSFAFFTRPTNQIWSYHVTQVALSKIFNFVLIIHLIY